MELYSDIYYVERIQAGDTGCFACLLDRYSEQVYTLIVRIVRNREEAEELSQDVFMKVFKNLSSFRGDCSFSTWIYRIAYNTAVSEVRKKKYEFLAIDEAQLLNISEEKVYDTLGQDNPSEQLDRLEEALTLLSPDDRALILLFYMQSKTIEEIAGITGLTQVNVKTKLHRIRKKIFVLLKKLEEKKV